VTAEARRAIAVVRRGVAAEQYALTVHFSQRMQQRGLFWADVEAVVGKPKDVRSQGLDDYDRPKWIISGKAASGGGIEIVCAIEVDDSGTVFITLYWD
jgi:hypothetical protein